MIIGLTGKLQSGKDTVADYLVQNYGFEKVGFSDALYDSICTLFDITREQAERFKEENVECHWARSSSWPLISLTHPISMRQILQRMGTEVGRDMFDQDFWVDILIDRLELGKDYVIRDVRFNNEATAVWKEQDYGEDVSIWKILRSGFDGDSHVSEAGIDDKYVSMILQNNSDIPHLYAAIDEVMEIEHGRRPVPK